MNSGSHRFAKIWFIQTRWKSKYGSMEVSDAKRLKQLEDEKRRLKQLVGELSLDNQALKYIIKKR